MIYSTKISLYEDRAPAQAPVRLRNEMPSLHKDGAALFTKRFMHTHVGTSDPGSSWIAPVFIFKYAINNKDFFATIVPVWIEKGLWRPLN